MKVLIPGYLYSLDNLEPSSKPSQLIHFIEKEEVDGKFVTKSNGTTNEEVLEVLIDRLKMQHKKLPSADSEVALDSLQTALSALHHRTQERKSRGVENTPLP